ncbi:MAG: RdgB/HAM1 family non-canonical purine NTP pyrophosphatase [Candidatus Marinimicrobia bacterium]|nr:RdgB/HAM1 family non-canonical purine NTP pyrophosphatase [Candidatus Neomarinimicrobiota bacterium]MBT5956402.1 RdgB/HAM1 family non-canonical purine NTP pyrophosphatase [Candidatus Neomarinimicrobiota bacterium]MBT6870982.1 RdgB/HAM1 family non-canonical purine NTP pyrophosphatase [Candidatus Neomarinimicrobiota bacterium]MBT7377523.1 RdgB/HAM1 family non-canonical purine NTP pyrophosphatase [Candidatus Neomarinimicrobiota bacterium]
MMKIILATHNADKRNEMMAALADLNIEILSLEDFPQVGEIIEDGHTLVENAKIKAKAVFDITGIPAISDDTGLLVDALDGAPGVYSARYAGEHATYSDNVNKLLDEMKDILAQNRGAQFQTSMVFLNNDTELMANGIVKGQITETPKGVGGFGYDPVFYIPEQEKTFAEMTIQEKNQISHRGIALRNLKGILHSYLNHPQIQENA